ncbi:50S ribosomal protein L19 [Candidatus Dependentiae bacterium]|nr:50S ribosomal protein L19 [Candidatus Dependentiae bacterium]
MKANCLTRETILDLGTERKLPSFRVGDTVEVSQLVSEGDKERIQLFEGDVICMHKNGISSTFTVRRMGANGIGVERIFPFYSIKISALRVVKRGDVRRAKLSYLRDRLGKAARIDEKILTKEQKAALDRE